MHQIRDALVQIGLVVNEENPFSRFAVKHPRNLATARKGYVFSAENVIVKIKHSKNLCKKNSSVVCLSIVYIVHILYQTGKKIK